MMEWNSVKDKIPEAHKDVLVWCHEYNENFMAVASLGNDGPHFWWSNPNGAPVNATHWISLPNAPANWPPNGLDATLEKE